MFMAVRYWLQVWQQRAVAAEKRAWEMETEARSVLLQVSVKAVFLQQPHPS